VETLFIAREKELRFCVSGLNLQSEPHVYLYLIRRICLLQTSNAVILRLRHRGLVVFPFRGATNLEAWP